MAAPDVAAARALARVWARRPGRAVIFDFNGTLSDDEPILERVFGELFAAHLGWSMGAGEYRARLLGHSDREIVEIAVREHGRMDESAADLVEQLMRARSERYTQLVTERSPITAGAEALVAALAAAQVPMGIVTGAQRADVEAVLAASPVGEHIAALVTDEDVARGKPDPSGYLLGAGELGVGPGDVLVFEDSVPGVTGALAAGMACIAVTGPDPVPALLEVAPAAIAALGVEVLADAGLVSGS